MHFSLINNEKVEASPKLKGLCPLCLKSVTAKCGEVRIWHWAHDANKSCDGWWESETEWHRAWKDKFPRHWQEVILSASLGEKHIADVQTSHGLVIEFQHSPLSSQERTARETFYGSMIWVVNGSYRKRDYPRFKKGKNRYFIPTNVKGFFLTLCPEECFPEVWLKRKVPVAFDFFAVSSAKSSDVHPEPLWYLLPQRIGGWSIVVEMSRDAFVSASSSRPHLIPNPEIIDSIRKWLLQQKKEKRLVFDSKSKVNRSAECALSSDMRQKLESLQRLIGAGVT